MLSSNEEVIRILDEDTHRYEGIEGLPKQPDADKDLYKTFPKQPAIAPQIKSPTASEMFDYDDLISSFEGKNLSTNNIFVTNWNLTDDSRLSNKDVVAEFSHHAFPKGNVSEMEAFSDDQTVEFMEFSSA
ncbi:unnamed protein product [Lactuca saligna]|uniref:Uncharacterized protein n=1 Tax=Lactuca saligna TaxID=75948 RepID=A0AA35ZHN6_LACSI|nr:unnamed protein product [Lactuca saligna]